VTSMTSRGRSFLIVGAGGNIGSQLIPHLAFLPGVGRVTLIDPDVYEEANLRSQAITPAHVGKKKARVQAQRLRQLNPKLEVAEVMDSVENLPLGALRADLIIACLDTRRARQYVNHAAWHLGVPWIDAGVQAEGLLARVNVYVPGNDRPCLECAWDEKDYELLEQPYPCQAGVAQAPATNAPRSLGALAASLQALECLKFVESGIGTMGAGRQVLIDALHCKHYLTRFERNPRCRLSDHEIWDIERLPLRTTEYTLQKVVKVTGEDSRGLSIRVEGKRFLRKLSCLSCSEKAMTLRLSSAMGPRLVRCPKCRSAMAASGFDVSEELSLSELSPRDLKRTLASIGLRDGEIITIGDRRSRKHYQLAGAPQ